MKKLELLAPAKNLEQGVAAVNHGADAVYIGAPLFGARVAAGNSVNDIEELVRYAHTYGARVYTTVNTILFDNELEDAAKLIRELYNVGVDALIIQDMGLLELDLPPIALHASTQTHNYDPRRIKFFEKAGFQRAILARETSIEQIREIHSQTPIELEAFVQGALCVCYSGQCYMSQYLSQRSGNRGCCGQPCRSYYDLYAGDSEGRELHLLRENEHLLSLKDFNASQHLAEMIDAGITSFKIEGRLKDLSYVKNVTAYYRQLLDSIIAGREDCEAQSFGQTQFFFTPDLEKTYNRGFTDYCLTFPSQNTQKGRKRMASISTQKAIGKEVGKIVASDNKALKVKSQEHFTSGDGLCFLNRNNQLEGFLVNHAEPLGGGLWRIVPNRMPETVPPQTTLCRNNDFAFEKQLQGNTAERKMAVSMQLTETETGLELTIVDRYGNRGNAAVACEKSPARDMEKATSQLIKQLSKMGDTPFSLAQPPEGTDLPYFFPASIINELRRQATANLIERIIQANRPQDIVTEKNSEPYFEKELDYRANVVNQQSAAFYHRHGVAHIEEGLEKTHDYEGKALMTTKYCIRYELGMCLKNANTQERRDLFLRNNKNLFHLEFDCARCEMQVRLAGKK